MATPEVHQLLINTVMREHDCVLQFDSEHQVLRSWLWPKDHSGLAVAPEKLREHRTSHNFLGPCCFCPALRNEKSSSFVEAAMLDRGDGEFVAVCPTDSCGYLASLGRIFERGNMPTVTYFKRGDDIKLPRVFHLSEDKENVFGRAHIKNVEPREEDKENIFGRAHIENVEPREACQGVDLKLPGLLPARRVLPRSVKYKSLILKLDSIVQPGVPENSLKLLFVKCQKCGEVTTRRVFVYHAC